ncbi:MAG TPA: alanine racemase [Paenalcaligenes hominis]|uniref:Alanine racemase n=1 Tax=Paenalcaligenes hominis TaxID=643674 RepID=A0A9D2VGC0_9BURK|nr:alanine racemase [Paenalcaligenes hominis]NJB66106.1 alanine racemase [Paenalcaligenes hominis]GGE73949.1 alanine racemase [Paenalcaligenes hominis]HJH24197.1 alanine racemase [Paenalcaligenes hominis]
MPRPIRVQVSIPALRHNLAQIRTALTHQVQPLQRPTPSIWAVIKANAYGHGIDQAVQGFAAADGLAMLDINEVVRCRERGWNKPLMLLEGFFGPEDLTTIDEHQITTVIHSIEQLQLLEQHAARLRHPLDVMVKLNTGMNRLGFAPEHFESVYRRLLQLQSQGTIGQLGKMTHFARADDDPSITYQQLQCFTQYTSQLPGRISVCNSAGTLTASLQQHLSTQFEQWVRPGICLYGASPFAAVPAHSLGLVPAQSLRAEIISIRDLAAHQGVGYGHSFISQHPMRLGVVACGYADGYPRHAPSGTPIWVQGQATQLVGRVSMDMLMVDLTSIPQAQVGSEVVLWGQDGPSVDEVALAAGTIGYELLCAVAPRVPRVVVEK